MTLQVFLLARLQGVRHFLEDVPGDAASFRADCAWVGLLDDVLPRAVVAELGLSPLLVGATGFHGSLTLLPAASLLQAESLLAAAAESIRAKSGGTLRLCWAATENLGEWPAIWRRLQAALAVKLRTPLAGSELSIFAPVTATAAALTPRIALPEGSATVTWSADAPADFKAGDGPQSFPLEPFQSEAKLREKTRWGVLRIDIDGAGARLAAAASAEEFISLSVLFHSFLGGEVARVAAMPDFKGNVAVLYTTGDSFAVLGTWECLMEFSREMRRVFDLFLEKLPEGTLPDQGRTLSAAIALTEESEAETLPQVYARANRGVDVVKASGRNAIALFGRILDWDQLREASQLKQRMKRLLIEYRCSPQFLVELESFYGAGALDEGLASARARSRATRIEKPWQLHRRLRRVIDVPAAPEFERQWTALMGDLIGRASNERQLRPAGRVALEWARLETSGRRPGRRNRNA